MDDQNTDRVAYEQAIERLDMLGANLMGDFRDRENRRRIVELRWYEDIRQYNGIYDGQVLSAIRDNEGSEVFVNITRPKTDAVEARLSDMVLPTDDRNWDVQPTPMPEMGELAADKSQIGTTPEGNPIQASDMAQAMRDVAMKKCDRMRDTIDDQLSECQYNAVVRQAIHDAAVLGIGIIKGPVVQNRVRKKWKALKASDGRNVMDFEIIEDKRPTAVRVDPWNFYPQNGCVNIEDSESEYERHFISQRQLRKLAKQPGYMPDQIRRVLKQGTPPTITADHRLQLKAIAGLMETLETGYELIEYNGPVDPQVLRDAGIKVDDDVLKEHLANVLFVNGIVIKAAKPVMDEGKAYKVFNLDRDDTTIFGRGVPRKMRTSQTIANTTFRMMVDNAGLSVGGQLIYAPGVVTPADGSPRMKPRKTWYSNDATVPVSNVFSIVQIPTQIEWLMPLFNLAMRLADEESALPLIAQGQSAQAARTKGEAVILNEASSIMLRRMVKGFDDGVTIPFISDMYAWNMLFNPDDEIKGDFNTSARGSSALMDRELQLQSFMTFIQLFGSNPMLSATVEWDDVADEAVRLMRVNRRLVKPSETIKDLIEKMQSAPQKSERVQVAEIGASVEGERLKVMKEIADDKHAIEIEKIASSAGLNREQFLKKLGLDVMKLDSENSRFNAEMARAETAGQGI